MKKLDFSISCNLYSFMIDARPDSASARDDLHAKPSKKLLSNLALLVAACSVGTVAGCSNHAAHRSVHGHRPFDDPERMAARWNDPERDRWQKPQEIVAALGLKPGDTVADLGAGTGYMVAHLSKAVGARGRVIAIDAEAAMIYYLQSNSSGLGPAKVISQKVGYSDPELKPAGVNAVLTLDTWHHVGGREEYAGKVHSALKSGGRFVVVDYTQDAESGPPMAMRLSPEQVAKELEAAGFHVEFMRESMPRHFMVVGHKH